MLMIESNVYYSQMLSKLLAPLKCILTIYTNGLQLIYLNLIDLCIEDFFHLTSIFFYKFYQRKINGLVPSFFKIFN